jgi:hypothetical protein
MKGVRRIWMDAIAARTSHWLTSSSVEVSARPINNLLGTSVPLSAEAGYQAGWLAGWLAGYPASGGGRQPPAAALSQYQQPPAAASQHLPPSPRQVWVTTTFFLTRALHVLPARARSRSDVYYVRQRNIMRHMKRRNGTTVYYSVLSVRIDLDTITGRSADALRLITHL